MSLDATLRYLANCRDRLRFSSSRHRVTPRAERRARFEMLEDRRMLAFDRSGAEQEMLEYLNWMRMDPPALCWWERISRAM